MSQTHYNMTNICIFMTLPNRSYALVYLVHLSHDTATDDVNIKYLLVESEVGAITASISTTVAVHRSNLGGHWNKQKYTLSQSQIRSKYQTFAYILVYFHYYLWVPRSAHQNRGGLEWRWRGGLDVYQ